MFTLRTVEENNIKTTSTKSKKSESSTTQNITNTTHSIDLDVFENKDQIVVLAQIPGATAENIEVYLEADMLTIRANVAQPEINGFEVLASECRFGTWERQIRLTTGLIEYKNLKANMVNGVLKITLVKIDTSALKINVD